MANFNTSNPDQLIYENSLLTIEVLGGVRLEGLDRMRVTLKVSLNQSAIPPIRHNLDLYNDTQLEKFIRKIAERLEVGTNVTAGTLAELTQGLENYRLEKIKDSQGESQLIKPLTEKERQAAEANLRMPNLLEETIHDLAASGIQGESENALILLLAMTSRKTLRGEGLEYFLDSYSLVHKATAKELCIYMLYKQINNEQLVLGIASYPKEKEKAKFIIGDVFNHTWYNKQRVADPFKEVFVTSK